MLGASKVSGPCLDNTIPAPHGRIEAAAAVARLTITFTMKQCRQLESRGGMDR
jgi:hypothetical protein